MKKIRVACVGDSITEGFGGVPYPEQLSALLGDGYDVRNFGKFGTHLRADCDWSYSGTGEYKAALNFLPDVVLFMLGTNDRLDEDQPFIDEYFSRDFKALVGSFLSLPSRPKVYIATSPSCYTADGTAGRVNGDIRRRLITCAFETGLPIIDINTCTKDRPDLFPDGLHPDTAGYALIADSFYLYAFGGRLCSVTVRTTPNTSVFAGKRRSQTDENGVAVMSVAAGSVTVTNGDKSVTLTLNKDTEIEL